MRLSLFFIFCNLLFDMGYTPTENKYYNVAEYFEIADTSENKYEYFFGEIVAMAGGSLSHNTITLNLVFALRTQLKGKNCNTYSADVRVEIVKDQMYVYPDVVLTCDKEDLAAENLLKNPALIVEVLSKSTAAFDVNEKLIYYMKLPSLQYYLTVAQQKCSILLHTKQIEGWTTHLYENLTDLISLPALGLTLSVAEIYDKINFPQYILNKKQEREND